MAKKESKKKGPGRPRKPVDEKLLRDLARIHCTQAEMSSILGVSVDTLHNNYSEIISQGMSDGKMSIRRAQLKAAEKGNTGMLIWLGKILLGQKEIVAISSAEPEVRELLRKWGAGYAKREVIGDSEKNSMAGDSAHVQRDIA